MKPIILNLDLMQDTHDFIEMMQGYDYNLECNLYEDGAKIDLSGYSVRVEMILGNKSFIVQTLDITVADNKVSIALDKDFTNHSGEGGLQVVISKNDRTCGSWLIRCRIKQSALGKSDDTKSKEDITASLMGKITEALETKKDLDISINNGNVAKNRSDLYEVIDIEIPRINSSLETIETEKEGLTKKRLYVANEVNDGYGTFEVLNFAGQGVSNKHIGQIIHHYTDATVMQLDNVGENNDILVLKNAHNPTRRADKPSNFCGNGQFIRMLTSTIVDGVEVTERSGYIGKNCEYVAENKPLSLECNKNDDGIWGISNIIHKLHANLKCLKNAGNYVYTIQKVLTDNLYTFFGNTIILFRNKIVIDSIKTDDGMWGYEVKLSNSHTNPFVFKNGSKTMISATDKSLNLYCGLRLIPSDSSTIENTSLFVDITDNNLKYKDKNGVIRVVNLT